MRKITLLLSMIATISLSAQTGEYFVDSSKADDSGDGTSWATAKKTIQAAIEAAPGYDVIFVKAGTYNTTVALDLTNQAGQKTHLYGGFIGTETEVDERAKHDVDGNGIIEPWEFTNVTTINSTAADKALKRVNRYLDGFTIIHNTTSTDIETSSADIGSDATVQNCIFRDSNINLSDVTDNYDANIIQNEGTFINNLIENNSVNVTTKADKIISPIINNKAYSSNNSKPVKFENNTVRNNTAIVTLDNVNSLTEYKNLKGLIFSVQATGTSIDNEIHVQNNVFSNNTAEYIITNGNGITGPHRSSGILGVHSSSKSITNINISNNTFVNNKMTNVKKSFYIFNISQGLKFMIRNNVLWNNTLDNAVAGINNNNDKYGAGSIVSNNISNGDINITDPGNGNLTIANNLEDLSSDNTTGNAPLFNLPSNVIGSGNDASIEDADWRITSTSYLAGKGTPISGLTTDKAGDAFDVSTPAVGAYEWKTDEVLSIETPVVLKDLLTITSNGVYTKESGKIKVYNLSSQLILAEETTANDFVKIESKGVFVIHFTSTDGKSVATKAIF